MANNSNNRNNDPYFGEFDPAPLFLSGASKKLTEEEHTERFGPPYGPCGTACDCKDCKAYRLKLQTEGPERPTVSPETYQFDRVITNILSNEPQADWRELIRNCRCFAKLWRDEDDSICTELECDLRDLCQTTWTSVKGGYTSPEENLSVPAPARRLGKPRRGRPPGKKKVRTGRYSRVPYVSTDRPVDLIGRQIYEFLGMPAHLPPNWYYGASKYPAQISDAKELFVQKFGSGLFIIERSSYHHYMLNGEHFMRFWVNAAYGGWMDCCVELAKTIMRTGKMDPIKTPTGGKSNKCRFYPYRVLLSSKRSVNMFKLSLTNATGLEYLFARSNNED